jgi:UDP:flavonoid glycosyltransferase YjiC (YdhE family)
MPRPKDWDPAIPMTGFCRLIEADKWTPPEDLEHFLREKEKPIYLGFGSLADAFSPAIILEMVDVLKEKNIHHGGVGTLSSGLHAGKPTFVIPCLVDQFFFGQKVVDWGVGPAPLAMTDFNREVFGKRLDELLQTEAFQTKATELQDSLLKERGVDQAYEWITHNIISKNSSVTHD